MTQHTYHGVTFSLITGDELSARLEEIVDRWGPDWRDDPVKRLVMDTFNECEHFIDHYEDAARLRAASPSPSPIDHSNDSARHNGQSETASAVHAKAFHKLAAAICCPPAVDDDEPARLRAKGAL